MEKRQRKIEEGFFENINGKRATIYLALIVLIYGFGLCFIGESMSVLTQNQSKHIINPEITAFLMFLCYTFALGILVYFIYYRIYKNKQAEVQKGIDEINKLAHMKEIEEKYSNFVNLLNSVLKEIFVDFDETKVSHEFLYKLEEYENEYNSVLPESFTEAACIFLALIKCPVVITDSKDENVQNEVLGLNVRIALSCAIKMIIHPFSVYINLKGEICKEYYEKVIMLFPDGNSLDGEEGQKVLNDVYTDILKNKGTQDISYYEKLFRKIYMNGRKR